MMPSPHRATVRAGNYPELQQEHIDPEALVRELEGMGIIVRAKTRSLLWKRRQRRTKMWMTW